MENPFKWLDDAWAKREKQPVTRRMRRLMIAAFGLTIAIYLLVALLDLHPWKPTWQDSGRLYGLASFLTAFTAIVQAWFWIWFVGRISRTTSLDERAHLDFGKPFHRLSDMHRFDVRVRVGREMRNGGRPLDERETLLERESERVAFRLLRRSMPLLLAAFWFFCLALPGGDYRAGLVMGAVVLSFLTIPMLVLPQVLRLWTEPDPAGDLPTEILPEP